MSKRYDPNSPEAAFGEEAKRKVIAALKKDGWMIVCLDELGHGRAALWEGDGVALPAMDIGAIKDGKFVLLDSKGKHQSTFTYTLGREDHGIDRRNYDWYRRQCEIAGVEPMIAIYEVEREVTRGNLCPSDRVLIYNLAEVSKRPVSQEDAPYGKGGMMFWPRGQYQYCYRPTILLAD